MDLGLKGKLALVMGASRGLGRGIAEALAAEGCNLLVSARNAARLDETAAVIRGRHGITVDTHPADLGDPAAAQALGDRAQALGGVDILVNISGGPPSSGALGVPPATWRQHFESMVVGLVIVTEAVVPGMRVRKWGRVLTVTSSGVIQPIATLGLANALRGSLVTWSKTLAGEVAADGVTVNVLVPGRIATERVGELDEAAARRLGVDVADIRGQSAASIPAGRYGSVAEFAAVAAFLASERASYVTGHMMRIDGGFIRAV